MGRACGDLVSYRNGNRRLVSSSFRVLMFSSGLTLMIGAIDWPEKPQVIQSLELADGRGEGKQRLEGKRGSGAQASARRLEWLKGDVR